MTLDEKYEAKQAEQMLREVAAKQHAALNGLEERAKIPAARIVGSYTTPPPVASGASVGAAICGGAVAKQMTVADYELGHKHRQLKLGERALDLSQQREVLISYLRVKMHAEDWHAVADVAMDLRELDAERKGMLV